MSEPPAPAVQELNLLPGPSEVQLSNPQVQPPLNSTPELYSYKNKLQEYAQKLSLRFPAYDTINEGSQHAPQFRSVVLVDGNYYKSTSVFPQRKLAEQDAARVALNDLSQKIKEDGRPLVCEDATFCKCILHEYTDKMHIEKPTYHTEQQEGLLPAFVSVVNFNGVSYNGGIGKSKKEAEQLAARAAILSVIDSDPSGIICKIIKSKVKLYSALNKMKDDNNAAIPALSSRSSFGVISNERKEVEATGIDFNLPFSTSGKITEMQAAIESFQALKKPRPEIAFVEIAPPIAFVPAGSQQLQLPSTLLQLPPASLQLPSTSLQLPSASLQLPSTSLQLPSASLQLPSTSPQLPSTSFQIPSASGVKRNRRSRKKNKKRSIVDAQMPAAVLPLRQIPPCSVTQ